MTLVNGLTNPVWIVSSDGDPFWRNSEYDDAGPILKIDKIFIIMTRNHLFDRIYFLRPSFGELMGW
jgi:hypothetical protein